MSSDAPWPGVPRRAVTALLAAGLATWRRGTASATDARDEIALTYLSLAGTAREDTGIAGARLGLADNATTGRFLGQGFAMQEVAVGSDPAATIAALAPPPKLLVADLPATSLLATADLPDLRDAVIIDIATPDDALRGAECRANVLHTAPSHAMLADALMQYLVVQEWRRILLLVGRHPRDAPYAAAIRRAAAKFRVTIAADRTWRFDPSAQQADTGHFQINSQVAEATSGASYDVVVAVDAADQFGGRLAYRTRLARPVAGTHGLVPTAWSPVMDEYGSLQLQDRFRRRAGRDMRERDYTAWLAVRAIGQAATRTRSTEPGRIAAYLRGDRFQLGGYKGISASIRAWDGQMRQPVLLTDGRSLVSIAPEPGFLHERNVLDTLGPDAPETECRR